MTRAVRVLVVDDSPANLRLLDAVLTPRGYDVVQATSGPEALLRLDDGDIDLVLLDVNMPNMNGYEVCRRIRETEATALLPVVMVTAAAEEERVRALEAGADDFLRQPVEQAELLARVQSLARLKNYHDTLEGQAAELTAWNRTLEEQVQEQLAELERLRVLRRFLSPQLAEAVFESGNLALLEPHRREIGVLVCELRGAATVSAGAGPEEALEALQAFHDMVGAIADEHGATIGFITGESALAFFGDPMPDPEPALRAVTLAGALAAASAELVERLARRGYEITGAIGISLGYATLGRMGSEGRADYGAVGPVVTRATRLCESAADGEVLIDQRALDSLEGAVEIGAVRDVLLRGLPEPVRAAPLVAVHRPSALPASSAPAARPPGAAVDVDLRVLGPLEVYVRGVPVPVTAARERTLLTLLVAYRGEVLAVDRLAEDLWAGSPPDSATAALRVHVSRLRRRLKAAGLGDILVTRPPGYLLDVPAESVDVVRFEALVAGARRAQNAGAPNDAMGMLQEALDLWRGPALAEAAGSPFAIGEAVRLEEARLVATEEHLDAMLACGHFGDAVGRLEALVRAHPLRERFWELLMLALYRAGRQPEALRAFQSLRDQLGTELGLEPSPALVRLEQAIVAHEVHP